MSCCECGFESPKHRFTCPTCAGLEMHSVFQVCGRDCQVKFWNVHKKSHPPKKGKKGAAGGAKTSQSTKKKQSSTTGAVGGGMVSLQDLKDVISNKQSWFEQLKGIGRAEEWFVDCYRMRLDDDYCWGGCYLHGLYDPDYQGVSRAAKSLNIVKDFLIFMKLAVANQVVPTNFDFCKCLREAAQLLNYAFEKSDAQEKWGGENVFSLRPSLRRTAELVYGKGCMAGGFREDDDDGTLQNTMEILAERFRADRSVCQDVGGQGIWKDLLRSL